MVPHSPSSSQTALGCQRACRGNPPSALPLATHGHGVHVGSSLAPDRCRARSFRLPAPMTLPKGLLLAETAPALARARICAARHLRFHQRPRPPPLLCLFPSPRVPVHSHPLSDPWSRAGLVVGLGAATQAPPLAVGAPPPKPESLRSVL